jgi:hypothetical protein
VLALLTIIAITVVYASHARAVAVPAAGGLVGHSLGIVGLTMMLLTETLYSLRKRAMRRPWGTMRSWLRFHIWTGIVGPYLVVLTCLTFNGLAEDCHDGRRRSQQLVGRYIYTTVPRRRDGWSPGAGAAAAAHAARREMAHPSTENGLGRSRPGGRGGAGCASWNGRWRRPLGAAHLTTCMVHIPGDGPLRTAFAHIRSTVLRNAAR